MKGTSGMNWQAQQAFERGDDYLQALRGEANVRRQLPSQRVSPTVPFMLLLVWLKGVGRAILTRPRLPSFTSAGAEETVGTP